MRFLSYFAGVGGFEQGLEAASHRCLWACEKDEFARAVYAYRFGHAPQSDDITTVQPGDLPDSDLWVGGFPCFPKGTLILCRDGLKDISEVKEGDEVFTHRSRWRRVVEVMKRQAYTLTVKGHGHFGLRTTAEHPFWTVEPTEKWDNDCRNYVKVFSSPKWTDAWELKGKYWATPTFFPSEQIPPFERESYERGLPNVATPAFFWFLGVWLGDGWVTSSQRKDRPEGQKTAFVRVCAPEGEDANELERRLRAAGLTVTRSKDSRESRLVKFVVSSKPLVRWLRKHFGEYCHGKKIPGWLLGADESLRRAFLDGYVWADGCDARKSGGLHYRATTINKGIALGVRLLACSLGYSVGWSRTEMPSTTVIEGRTVTQQAQHQIQMYGNSRQTRVFGDHRFGPVRSVEPNQGPMETVYNFEVEEDNSYVADGIVVHNCQDASTAGQRRGLQGGTRSGLVWTFLALAQARWPEWLLMENVPGLLSVTKGADYHDLLISLDGLGYDVAWRILDARYFGVPQRRRRVFILARLRNGKPTRPWQVMGTGWEGAKVTRLADERTKSWANSGGVTTGTVWETKKDEWFEEARIPSSLRDILERGPVDPRYYLSAKACEGILRRAERRGRKLPPALEAALRGAINADAIPELAGTLGGGSGSRGHCADLDRAGAFIPDVASAVAASAGHHGHSSPRGDGSDNLIGVPDPAYALAAHGSKCVSQRDSVDTFVVGAFHSNAGTRDPGWGNESSPPVRIGSGVGIASPPAVVLGFKESQSGTRFTGDTHPTLDANKGSRRQEGVLLSFDVAQITSPDNRTAVKPGDPTPTPAASDRSRIHIAYGIASDVLDRSGEGKGGTARERSGMMIREDESLTLRSRHPNAVATITYAPDVAPTLTAPDPVHRTEDGKRQDGSRQDRLPIVVTAHETGQGWWKEDDAAGTLRAEGENRPSRPSNVVAFQQHGSDVGEMGALRRGHGDVQSGVPFIPVPPPTAAGVPFIVNAAESCAKESHARETDYARCLDQTGGFAANQGGTVVTAFTSKGDGQDAGTLAPTLRAMGHRDSHLNGGGQVAVAVTLRGREGGGTAEVAQDGNVPALRASQGGGDKPHVFSIFPEPGQGADLRAIETVCFEPSVAATAGAQSDRGVRVVAASAVRRLTPRECERLQGMPDDWTLVPWKKGLAPDSLRYRAIGNAVATVVLRAIGERLMSVEEWEAQHGW